MKKMKIVVLMLTTVLAILLSMGCGKGELKEWKKDNYILNYYQFIDTLSVTYTDMNQGDWEKAVENFEDFSRRKYLKYQDAMTSDDIDFVNRLNGQFRAIQIKYNLQKAERWLENKFKQIEGVYDELI